MTKPKMVLCEMSGQRVVGPVELDGTAYCSNPRCRSTTVRTKKVTRADGKVQRVYADHCRASEPIPPQGRSPGASEVPQSFAARFRQEALMGGQEWLRLSNALPVRKQGGRLR